MKLTKIPAAAQRPAMRKQLVVLARRATHFLSANRTDSANAELMLSSAVPVVYVYPPLDEDLTMITLRRVCLWALLLTEHFAKLRNLSIIDVL